MQLISFYISVPFLAGIYLMIYQFAVILLLIGTLVKNKVKREAYNLLYVFNTMIAWSVLFTLFDHWATLFMAYYGQNPYEWYAFKGGISDKYWTLVLIISLLFFLLGLLMFFRKLRTKRWFTLLFSLSNSSFFFERTVIFITDLYRDYIPSSWSTYSENTYSRYIYSYTLIIVLLIVIYLWAKKRGRLPFPSVFLK